MINWAPIHRITEEYRKRLQRLITPKMITSEEWYEAYARWTARQMVTGLLAANAKTWRQAATESLRGREVARALQEEMRGQIGRRVNQIVEQNAELISSISQSYAKVVTQVIAEGQRAGLRASALTGELGLRLHQLTRARINMIARTEVSKASVALTQARAEELDIDWYVWRTSQDQRVRQSHRKMSGVLVSWDDPPSPEQLAGERSTLGHYTAGNAPNCRCYPEPLLRLEQVNWPHRVYYGGRIQYMTRAHFAEIQRVSVAA